MSQLPPSHDTGPSASSSMADRITIQMPRASGGRQLPPCTVRALAIWPGLDRARLLRTKGDPARIAALVTPRTVYSAEHVIAMLTKNTESRS